MARALQAEVGAEVPLDAVLASSGGGIKGGQALWRGRSAQIGLLTTQLAAARQRLVGELLKPNFSSMSVQRDTVFHAYPASCSQKLSLCYDWSFRISV